MADRGKLMPSMGLQVVPTWGFVWMLSEDVLASGAAEDGDPTTAEALEYPRWPFCRGGASFAFS